MSDSSGSRKSGFDRRAFMASALAANVRPGDLVITMGAGDVTRCGPELLTALGMAAA